MSACERHRAGLVEMARGGPTDADARGHAASCPACTALLAEEEALTRALRRLANADVGCQASPALERRLREGLGTLHGTGARRWASGAWIGVAAALVAAVALAALLAGRRPAVAPEAGGTAETRDFAPLVHGDALEGADALHLTRVRVPRSALVSLGWPGPMEDGPPLEAEVLVGQDGLARGIRFVDDGDGGAQR